MAKPPPPESSALLPSEHAPLHSLETDWDIFCAIETEIGQAEATGIEARWRCGRMLLRYEKRQGSKYSPLADAVRKLSAEFGVSERELLNRRQFAEEYPNFCPTGQKFSAWHEVRDSLGTRGRESPEDTTPNEEGGWDSLEGDLHDEHGGVVNPALVKHFVRDGMRRDKERQRRRREYDHTLPVVAFNGSPMAAVTDHQCPYCLAEWSGRCRPHDPKEAQGPDATSRSKLLPKVHPDAKCFVCGGTDDLRIHTVNRENQALQFVCSWDCVMSARLEEDRALVREDES